MKKPLIFDFCTSRRNDVRDEAYYYDIDKNLNVIDLKGITIPFVSCEIPKRKISFPKCIEKGKLLQSVVELETETRISREGADDDVYGYLLELMTKTEVARESDDEE